MKFTDVAERTREGKAGLLYESECGRWRVSRRHMGPGADWLVWQARDGGWLRRLAWAALATPQEAMVAAAALARLPHGGSLRHAKAAAGWYARRFLTALVARASAGSMVAEREGTAGEGERGDGA